MQTMDTFEIRTTSFVDAVRNKRKSEKKNDKKALGYDDTEESDEECCIFNDAADKTVHEIASLDMYNLREMVGEKGMLKLALQVSGMDPENAYRIMKGEEIPSRPTTPVHPNQSVMLQEFGDLQRRIRGRVEGKHMFVAEKQSTTQDLKAEPFLRPAVVSVVIAHTPDRYALVNKRIDEPGINRSIGGVLPPGVKHNALPSALLRDYHQRYLVYRPSSSTALIVLNLLPPIWPILFVVNMVVDTVFMVTLGIIATLESFCLIVWYGVFTIGGLEQSAMEYAIIRGDWAGGLKTSGSPVHFMVPTVNSFVIMECFLISLLLITVELLNLVLEISESNKAALWTDVGLIAVQYGVNNLATFMLFAKSDAADEKKIFALQSTGTLPDASGNIFRGRVDAINRATCEATKSHYDIVSGVSFSACLIFGGGFLGIGSLLRGKYVNRKFAPLFPVTIAAVLLVNIVLFDLIRSVEDGAGNQEIYDTCAFAASKTGFTDVAEVCGKVPRFFGRGLFLQDIEMDITLIVTLYLFILFSYMTAEISRGMLVGEALMCTCSGCWILPELTE
eukprot:m.29696 g.29696  ORF g.29696 m.29696 type:complete len:561 (+) comp8127_c0_seq2:143-1825(+)